MNGLKLNLAFAMDGPGLGALRAGYDVAVRHRAAELRLNALSPELHALAVANKRAGFKTEPAYYAALFPEGAPAAPDPAAETGPLAGSTAAAVATLTYTSVRRVEPVAVNDPRAYEFLLRPWAQIEPIARARATELLREPGLAV